VFRRLLTIPCYAPTGPEVLVTALDGVHGRRILHLGPGADAVAAAVRRAGGCAVQTQPARRRAVPALLEHAARKLCHGAGPRPTTRPVDLVVADLRRSTARLEQLCATGVDHLACDGQLLLLVTAADEVRTIDAVAGAGCLPAVVARVVAQGDRMLPIGAGRAESVVVVAGLR
jgi:hypothetical protein